MKLSILIATIGRRNDLFEKLVNYLIGQIGDKPIEIVAYWNNGELSIGEIRRKLLESATGEYVCFIDDDDWVPEDYCDAILSALGKDYVGFNVEVIENDNHRGTAFHSLQYTIWSQDGYSYYRGVTHLNPIRRGIALKGDFTIGGSGEDEAWARSVTSITKTENYLDRIMYYYRHDTENTTFGGKPQPQREHYRPGIRDKRFRYHKDSKTKGVM